MINDMTITMADGTIAVVQYSSRGVPERMVIMDDDGNAVAVPMNSTPGKEQWTVARTLSGVALLLDAIKEES